MKEERPRTQSMSATLVDRGDSFDALLRKAAHVSETLPATSARLLPVGTKLSGGRLSILRRIGEGGMGVVYEAFDAQRRSRVALKTLTQMDAASIYRLKTEFRVLLDVVHENLVKLYELWSDGDLWCFTMELVEGERFDRWVRPRDAKDDFNEERLRAAMPQLISAVDAIHRAGRLHRDLKPSNVLVTPRGRVVVLDFGLAIQPELGSVGHTLTEGNLSGTPAYMAPEQASGDAMTAASDYYAIGVMLFEALTGKLPFDGRIHDVLANKQRDDAPRASTIRPDVARDLDELCARLLSRDASLRPSFDDLEQAFPPLVSEPKQSSISLRRSASGRETSVAPRVQEAQELFGRDNELGMLREAYDASRAGKPVALFVVGESGMGKSALCEAFLQELGETGEALVLAGRCYERENVPFKAFDALIDELSRYLRRLPESEAAALLPRDIHTLVRLFPVLGRVPVVAISPARSISDPHEVQRRAFKAFGEMLGRLRDRRPLVVFIDDLQWTDHDSVRFLRHLLLHPDPVPLMMIVSHRSEGLEDNSLLSSIYEACRSNRILQTSTLGLSPLSGDACMQLVQMLAPDAVNDALAKTVVEEAAGSPFFAQRLAAAAQDGTVATLTLQQVIQAQVATLGETARRLLQALALAGQPLPTSVALDAIGSLDGHAEVDALRSARLIRVARSASSENKLDRLVECYHDKIRESVGDAIAPLLMRELSAGLARALLEWQDADPELLIRCLEGAGSPQEAGERAALAGEAALQGLAFDRAARLYEKALALGTFSDEHAQALRIAYADTLAAGGHGRQAAEAYLAAREATQDEHQRVQLSRSAGEHFLMCGQLDRGRACLEEVMRPLGLSYPQSLLGTVTSLVYRRGRLRMSGLALASRPDRSELRAQQLEAIEAITRAALRSDHARAGALSAWWVRLALDAGDQVAAARALAWELFLAMMVGSSPGRIDALEQRAQELCTSSQDILAEVFLSYGRGFVRLFRGELELSLASFQRGVDLYIGHPELRGAAYDRPWQEWARMQPLVMLGRVREVAARVQVLAEAAWARGDLTILPNLYGGPTGALAMIAVGELEELERALNRIKDAWTASEPMQQDLSFNWARVFLALAQRDAEAALNIAMEHERRLAQSALARTTMLSMHQLLVSVPAICAVVSAMLEEPKRAALLRQAERKLSAGERFIRRAGALTMGEVPLLAARAAIDCQRGHAAQAVEALRQAVALPSAPPFHIACARYRLGQLLGGAEGSELIAKADKFLCNGGATNPELVVSVFMPGIELR